MRLGFVVGVVVGWLLVRSVRRSMPAMLYPVVTDTDYQPGDAWPPTVTWSVMPPNPGGWN